MIIINLPQIISYFFIFLGFGILQGVFWEWFSYRFRDKPSEIASPCEAVAVPASQDGAYHKLRIYILYLSVNRTFLNIFITFFMLLFLFFLF